MVFVNSVGFIAITAILCTTICNGKSLYDDIDTNGPEGKAEILQFNFDMFSLLHSPSHISFSTILIWHEWVTIWWFMEYWVQGFPNFGTDLEIYSVTLKNRNLFRRSIEALRNYLCWFIRSWCWYFFLKFSTLIYYVLVNICRFGWSKAPFILCWQSIWPFKWRSIEWFTHHTATWFSLPSIWQTS